MSKNKTKKETETKYCRHCEKHHPIDEFLKDEMTVDGLTMGCKRVYVESGNLFNEMPEDVKGKGDCWLVVFHYAVKNDLGELQTDTYVKADNEDEAIDKARLKIIEAELIKRKKEVIEDSMGIVVTTNVTKDWNDDDVIENQIKKSR